MYCLSKTPELEPDFFKWSQDEKINFKNSKKILKNSKKISKIMFIILFNVADFLKIILIFFLRVFKSFFLESKIERLKLIYNLILSHLLH